MEHAHQHHTTPERITRALIIGLSLNLLFVIIEAGVGFCINSLALLTDAGHNLSDTAGLFFSFLAVKLSQKERTDTYTYGYKKSSILASLFNAILLMVAVGAIIWEAVRRFWNPVETLGKEIIIVASIGVLINTATALLFLKDQKRDINIKSAYLHMVYDSLVSVGVVLAGVLILYTGWIWVDPVTSLIIAIVIIWGTWGLLSESTRLAMDGVPPNIDLKEVKSKIQQIAGVKIVHHVHVWAMSTTENALTAHLVLEEEVNLEEAQKIKKEAAHELEHLHIHHATFEMETSNSGCDQEDC